MFSFMFSLFILFFIVGFNSQDLLEFMEQQLEDQQLVKLYIILLYTHYIVYYQNHKKTTRQAQSTTDHHQHQQDTSTTTSRNTKISTETRGAKEDTCRMDFFWFLGLCGGVWGVFLCFFSFFFGFFRKLYILQVS